MRILLFGEYSNVHHTLCEALRRAGHEVLLVSDGDGWKDYPRDIDLRRRQPGPVGSLRYLWSLLRLLPRLRGFDVVQIINPVFLDVKPRWNRWMFSWLKRHNGIVSVGCFGDDYYVISRMQDDRYLSYTDFFAAGRKIDHEVNQRRIAAWLHSPKAALTCEVMARADGLVACLYEYWKVYHTPEFEEKLHYIALPIEVKDTLASDANGADGTTEAAAPLRILFASQKLRGQMKGTDQLEPLFDRLAQEHPGQILLDKIVSVPFDEYQRRVAQADVIVDQLYSFTPAMAALESMSHGKVVISGFEPEYAAFLGDDDECFPPLLNLRPFEPEANYRLLEETLLDRKKIARLKQNSQAFVKRYHDADVVARQYVEAWNQMLGSSSSKRSSQR